MKQLNHMIVNLILCKVFQIISYYLNYISKIFFRTLKNKIIKFIFNRRNNFLVSFL